MKVLDPPVRFTEANHRLELFGDYGLRGVHQDLRNGQIRKQAREGLSFRWWVDVITKADVYLDGDDGLGEFATETQLDSLVLVGFANRLDLQAGRIENDAVVNALLVDERGDVDTDTLVALEWAYLPVLEYSRRPARVLLRALSEQPSLFIEMLSAVFKPSEESGVLEPPSDNPEHARAVANQAYRLLELWDVLPGTRDNGTIDGEALEAWIRDARSRAKAVGREDIADSRIGNMLSASPSQNLPNISELNVPRSSQGR